MLSSKPYFDISLPDYFNFGPVLEAAFEHVEALDFDHFRKKLKPQEAQGVNYLFLSNKDGNLAWRPFELINPIIYAKMVHLITEPANWKMLQERMKTFEEGVVECCSIPVVSTGKMTDVAEQILLWWNRVEQRSLELSFEFSHVAVTDVSNCYPSIYTHAIAWAIHGKPFIKLEKNRFSDNLLGNQLDYLVRASREGQTNGIPQASIVCHLFAELILGYCDQFISGRLKEEENLKIIRYRDDFRVFGMSDVQCQNAIKVISEELLQFGMRLGASKTSESTSLVSSAVKPEKVDALALRTSQKTLQKELLVIHKFATQNANAGALKVLLKSYISQLAVEIDNRERYQFENKKVLVAILSDIAVLSPNVQPAVARAISLILKTLEKKEAGAIFELLVTKANRLPNSGYLDVWLQRMAIPANAELLSTEGLCKKVSDHDFILWNFRWLQDDVAEEKFSNFSIVDPLAFDGLDQVIPESEIDDFWHDYPS